MISNNAYTKANIFSLNKALLYLAGFEFVLKQDNCSLYDKSAIFCMETHIDLPNLKIESYSLYDHRMKNYSCSKFAKLRKLLTSTSLHDP